jgi:hypothetical protein
LRYCGARQKGEMVHPSYMQRSTPIFMKNEYQQLNKTPLNTFNKNFDFYKDIFILKTGVVGFKLWIYYIDTHKTVFRTRRFRPHYFTGAVILDENKTQQ